MRIGLAAHTLVLTPDRWDSEYAVGPECDRRTKDGKAEWYTFMRKSEGKIQLTVAEADTAYGVAQSVKSCYLAQSLLERCPSREAAVFWKESVDCKARLDAHGDSLVLDLKTTGNAHPGAFQRHFWNMRYYLQATHYAIAYEKLTGEAPIEFVFLAVETKPPYPISVHVVTPDVLEVGKARRARLVELFRKCMEDGIYPSWEDRPHVIEVPKYLNLDEIEWEGAGE